MTEREKELRESLGTDYEDCPAQLIVDIWLSENLPLEDSIRHGKNIAAILLTRANHSKVAYMTEYARIKKIKRVLRFMELRA